ncbi:TVP38/TMEM64 family protein [Rhodobacteraceae bacterium RKSG542]|uniref:TVP38/TMEM64 family protein n=1 Tax=Pseudovibrio flavus TaxID=2529854 RepID=UPI0012BCEDDC|nr:TVP38/TMEM64 family protein [Pseudovibrio flavus]MTI17149.1 TVP38/TMEM64 family protein [Pseudovibrio flavus]
MGKTNNEETRGLAVLLNWRVIKRWLPLVVIGGTMAFGFSMGWHEQLTLSELIKNRLLLENAVVEYPVLSVLIYMGVYILAVSLSFPGASFLTILGGFLFGWWLAGTATVIAATIGAALLFLAARTSLGTTLKEKAGPFLSKMSNGFQENAFSYLLFLRLTPVFPFWLVNIAPALFHMKLSPYVLATAIGIIPGTFAYSFVGSGLDSIIAAQEAADPGCASAGRCQLDIAALITPQLLLAFAALGIVALIPVVVKKLRKPQA